MIFLNFFRIIIYYEKDYVELSGSIKYKIINFTRKKNMFKVIVRLKLVFIFFLTFDLSLKECC